jgi:hypothetical protein
MATILGAAFVFMVNQMALPNLFFVKISRRIKTLPRYVAFYEPCVFLLPPKNGNYPHNMLRYYHSVVKESIVLVLQDGDHDMTCSRSQLWMIAVQATSAAEALKTCNKRNTKINECQKLHAK